MRSIAMTVRGVCFSVVLGLVTGALHAATNNLEQAQKKGSSVGDPVLANSGAYYFAMPLFDLGGPLPLTYRLNYQMDWEAEFKLESGFSQIGVTSQHTTFAGESGRLEPGVI
jgi:hypothetical protein